MYDNGQAVDLTGFTAILNCNISKLQLGGSTAYASSIRNIYIVGNIIRNDQLFIMGDDLIIRFASSGNPVDFNYTDPNAGKHTTVGGIEFVDENGESIGGGSTSSTTPPTNHESGKNTTVGGIEFI